VIAVPPVFGDDKPASFPDNPEPFFIRRVRFKVIVVDLDPYSRFTEGDATLCFPRFRSRKRVKGSGGFLEL
jgi:hypothetical protein